MNTLKAYHKLPPKEFNDYLNSKKSDINTLHFFEKNEQSFFLSNDDQTISLATELIKKQSKFDFCSLEKMLPLANYSLEKMYANLFSFNKSTYCF